MGLTYDGITYRSLEEQVRYDAEQIQLLKQADVTINENLQTINTEVDGKLTKPANPSAESAVTMLADGTVGTKLLSEIGGSGGKLYRHDIIITFSESKEIYLNVYSSSNTEYNTDTFSEKYTNVIITISLANNSPPTPSSINIDGGQINFYTADDSLPPIYISSDISSFTDTVTEV